MDIAKGFLEGAVTNCYAQKKKIQIRHFNIQIRNLMKFFFAGMLFLCVTFFENQLEEERFSFYTESVESSQKQTNHYKLISK